MSEEDNFFSGLESDDDFDELDFESPLVDNIKQNNKQNNKVSNTTNIANTTNNVPSLDNSNYQLQLNDRQLYDKYKKKPLYALLGIILILAYLIMGFVIIKPSLIKSGITTDIENTTFNMTYSQLLNHTFSVNNKSKKDVSEETEWYLNDNLINSGSNFTNVDMKYIKWGENHLIALNNEDAIDYTIMFNRSTDTDDDLHTLVSLMLEFPENFFKEYKVFEEDDETVNSKLLNNNNIKKYNDGILESTQTFNDIKLITEETKPFSLKIGNSNILNNQYKDYKYIEVYGNWETVKEAKLNISFNQDEPGLRGFILHNGTIDIIDKSDIIFGEDYADINIYTDGVYVLDYNDVDYTEFKNIYNIVLYDNSDIKEVMAKTKEQLIQDIIDEYKSNRDPSNDPEDYDVDAAIAKVVDKLNITDEEILDNLKLETLKNSKKEIREVTNKLKDNAKSNSNIDIQIRYYGIISNENNEIFLRQLEDYSVTSDYYVNKTALIVDFRKMSYDQISNICETLNSKLFGIVDLNIIAFTDNVKGITSITDWGKNITIYEYDSPENVTNSEVNKINKGIDIGHLENIDVNGIEKDIEVIKIADSKFNVDSDSINCKPSIDNVTNSSNSFGYAILSKLVYEKRLNDNMISSGGTYKFNYEHDKDTSGDEIPNSFLDDIQLENKVSTVDNSKQIIDNFYSGSLYENSNIDDNVVSILNLAILNNTKSNLYKLTSVNELEFINSLVNELNEFRPVLGVIENEYGLTSILITKVYQSNSNKNDYYLCYYNPINPGIEQIGYLRTYTGISEGEIGTGYEFTSNENTIIYKDLNIINKVAVYDGNENYEISIIRE